ncbi:hypothetical protein CBS101457_001188 [Exobasidium rhododendri]|nr:hypothetical protein CBS101457_001188 [Exobasidium rhododendri]
MRGHSSLLCWARPSFLLIAAVLLALSLSASTSANALDTESADFSPRILSYEEFPIVGSPQEAYDRALTLLRSTLVNPSGVSKAGSEAYRERPGSSSKYQKEQDSSIGGTLRSFWEALKAWSPWGIVERLLNRIVDLIRFHTPLRRLFRDTPTSPAARLAASLKKRKAVWEGSSLVTSSQSFAAGKDPVEEEQALKFPGARKEQIWPEWDGGDDVFFGPFHSTVVDESSLKIKGMSKVEESFQSVVGSKVQALKKKASFNATSSKKKKILQKKKVADRKRAEAIALLTWASGWGDAEVVQDEASLLGMPASVNWSQEAGKGALIGSQSSESYISSFFANSEEAKSTTNHSRPHADALWVLGFHSLWGTHGTTPKPARAKACFERLAALNGNATAHNKLAWLEGGAWGEEGWNLMGVIDAGIPSNEEERQAKALVHYAAAARAGDTSAQNSLAFRFQAGIGVEQDCGAALYWYEKVAEDAHQRFTSGPPGGLTLPYTHLRLSDISGGVYGPGSSAASTGLAKHRPAIQAALHSLPSDGSSDGRRIEDLLEFFTYHADRGSSNFALRLARVYYGGSVLGSSESAARVQRDYRKAKEYLLKITSDVWPTDSAMVRRGGPVGQFAKQGQRGEDIKLAVDDALAVQAGIAAGMMGKMWLRGEGVHRNHARAWVWFSRGADQGDPESYNGLGLMFRDGLGIPRDVKKAAEYFEAAAGAHSVDGCINLAKFHFEMKDFANAARWFDVALKLGNSFEAYYYLAQINIKSARFAKDRANETYKIGPPGTAAFERCRNAVNGYKFAVERADWKDGTFTRAERAWSKGFKAKALLGWAMAGEKGFEAAQNNVAWVLDRDKQRLRVDLIDAPENNLTDRLALIHWIRSAAQDNVDALVKMGDYYFHGLGLGEQTSFASASSPSPPVVTTASFDKAAACYSSAADKQTSALAYWNMGYLYEKGLGVPKKDYNLAKRYYDMALDLNPQEAYLPVFLSLTKLFLMALWDAFANKDASALSLLNGFAFRSGGKQSNILGSKTAGPFTEADEAALRKEAEEIESEISNSNDYYNQGGSGEEEGLADSNLPESYSNIGGERRGKARGEHEDSDYAEFDDENLDDTIEGLMIVIGLAALAWLFYARQGVQLRLERMRRENQGEATGDRVADETHQQGPPAVDPNQPFGWPLNDGNAYAGL